MKIGRAFYVIFFKADAKSTGKIPRHGEPRFLSIVVEGEPLALSSRAQPAVCRVAQPHQREADPGRQQYVRKKMRAARELREPRQYAQRQSQR